MSFLKNSEHKKSLLSRDIFLITDVYTLAMLGLYSLLAVILFGSLTQAENLLFLNGALVLGIIAIAVASSRISGNGLFKLFRRLYLAPLIFLIYSQVQHYIRVVNPYFYDDLLIIWDKWIFGVNPTEWMMCITNPILTEYLQFCYVMYFVLPIIQAVELHRSGKDKHFNEFASNILFNYYISYLLYFILPAVGPRFTLHLFELNNIEMPGLFLADFFREMINRGAGILPGAADPALMVNRDCFPSGHTMITLANIILAFKFKSKFRIFILVIGGSLIFSTVYLRYHYVVDVIAGILLAMLVLWLEPKLRSIIEKKLLRKEEES